MFMKGDEIENFKTLSATRSSCNIAAVGRRHRGDQSLIAASY